MQQPLPAVPGHRLGLLGGEGPGEDAEPIEEACGGGRQPLVRPADRGLEAAVAGGAALTRASEDIEPFTQVGEDLRRGEAAGADRGELDRQRQPVQAPAELHDGRVQRQLHPEVAGACLQQQHRGRVPRPLRLVGVGYGKRGQRQHPLAGDIEGFAAGGQPAPARPGRWR